MQTGSNIAYFIHTYDASISIVITIKEGKGICEKDMRSLPSLTHDVDAEVPK